MKKMIICISLVCILLSTTFSVGGISNNRPLHGTFHAELGIKDNTDPVIELDGLYKDFRGRHLLTGSISHLDSDRLIRFQGMITRNIFLIQTGYRNHIVNVIGKFVSYDEGDGEYRGLWRGFANGYGWTTGWIIAELNN
jgi:hypothetical protein